MSELARETSPGRFISRAFEASARNLAVAARFLPAEMRQEGQIAFLCCRALDAHEDLNRSAQSAVEKLVQAAEFMTGRCNVPPELPDRKGTRDSDALEHLIASRLQILRDAVSALRPSQCQRVCALITDMAQAMAGPLRFGRSSRPQNDGQRVLGRAFQYALELLGADVPATVDLALLGRACQAANDLRDLHVDEDRLQEDVQVREAQLWLGLAEAATSTTNVLKSVRFHAHPGTVAATMYLAATTLKSVAKRAGQPLPPVARHPVLCAALVAGGCIGFREALDQFDSAILSILLNVVPVAAMAGQMFPAAPLDEANLGFRQDDFESAIADGHPDPSCAMRLKQACRLLRYSILLTSRLSDRKLSAQTGPAPDGRILMISDCLMAAAFHVLQDCGLPALSAFGRTVADLSDAIQERPEPVDRCGHLAAFVSEVVASARGAAPITHQADALSNRTKSRRLHELDHRASRKHRFAQLLYR